MVGATSNPEDVQHTTETQIMGVAAFVILIWDHFVTLPVEIKHVWSRKLFQKPYPYPLWIFLLNRYLTPLGFSVNLWAYFWDGWDQHGVYCQEFIRYEGAMIMIGIGLTMLLMLLRIRALYHEQLYVQYTVLALWFFFIGVNAWLLTEGEPVPHFPGSGMKSCTMIFNPDGAVGRLSSASAWIPLLYETVIFSLTVYKVMPERRKSKAEPGRFSTVANRLLQDGAMYFAVIMSVTLVLTVMIAAAPPGIKNISAQWELILTVTMMSRITLRLKSLDNLKKKALQKAKLEDEESGFEHSRSPRPSRSSGRQHRHSSNDYPFSSSNPNASRGSPPPSELPSTANTRFGSEKPRRSSSATRRPSMGTKTTRTEKEPPANTERTMTSFIQSQSTYAHTTYPTPIQSAFPTPSHSAGPIATPLQSQTVDSNPEEYVGRRSEVQEGEV